MQSVNNLVIIEKVVVSGAETEKRGGMVTSVLKNTLQECVLVADVTIDGITKTKGQKVYILTASFSSNAVWAKNVIIIDGKESLIAPMKEIVAIG